MSKQLVHTPEGVRDIYGEEFAKKLLVENLLHSKLRAYGYQDIQTPTFEFFDVFSKEIGTVPSRELYKFFDKEGNTLVLRPDFTPSIARCAAKYFMEQDIPIRFSYVGNTFVNNSSLQGKLKESTEMGAELIGDDSPEADAEMISLVVEALLNTGLKDFQVSVGEVDFFKGLCEEAGLSEDTELLLRDYISNKNFFAAEDLLRQEKAGAEDIDVILKVTGLFGTIESLQEAKKLVTNARSLRAVERLEAVYHILTLYEVEQYVSFDLGMLSQYNYYTGIIVKAYTYGVGDVIVKGGRYDTLLNQFGKQSAAIGFMILVDGLLAALSRQQIPVEVAREDTLLLYGADCFAQALSIARQYRGEGMRVELMRFQEGTELSRYIEFAGSNMLGGILYFASPGQVQVIDVLTGEVTNADISTSAGGVK